MEFYKSLVLPSNPRGNFGVILGHCIYSLVLWRNYEEAQRKLDEKEGKSTGKDDEPVSAFYAPIAGYFCYGYGGGTVRDWVMAQPPTAFTNPDVIVGWLYAYALLYHTGDGLYNLLKAGTPFSPLKGLLMGLDAIDNAGGVCASCEKAARLFPENPSAPFLGGMLISLGGSLFRYLEQKSRGRNPKTEWAKPTAVFKRGVFYTLVYLTVKRARGNDAQAARLFLVTMHLVRTLLSNATGVEIFPFLV